jgi:hypothetical protein
MKTRRLRGMVVRGMYALMENAIQSVTFKDGTVDEFRIGWNELPPKVRENWIHQGNFIDAIVQADDWNKQDTDKEH